MAYVPGVKNDLFISYAHVDNETDSHGLQWVSEFVRGFGLDVRQRLGGPKNFTLFFDESDLHAHHQLQILLQNARQSAVFVAVMSPSYVAHDWTMQELRAFAELSGDTHRIVVVEKLPLDTSDRYPSEIADHKRTQFWKDNAPVSYAPSTLTATGTPMPYKETLAALAFQVQQLLREMRKEAFEQGLTDEPPKAEPKSKPAPPNPVPLQDTPATPPPPKPTIAQPPLRYATIAGGPAPDDSSGHAVLIDLIWPADGKRWLRNAMIVAAFAVTSGAITANFLSAITYPQRIEWLFLTMPIAAILIHFAGAGLGTRLGTGTMAIAALVSWGFAYSAMPTTARTGFGGMFLAMISAVFVLGRLADRGWTHRYWRTVLATFLAATVFAVCVAAGAYLNEFQQGRATRLMAGLAVETILTAVGTCAAFAAGYSLVAAAVFHFARRWTLRRFA